MNLLFISQYFPPETGAGATRTEAMVKYLVKRGWDIEVISELPNYPTGKIYSDYNSVCHQSESWHGALIHRVWVWANPRSNTIQQLGIFTTYLISAILFALRKPRKYDVVYATSPPIFAAIAGAIIAKFLGSKFVLEVRDIWPDAAVDAGKIEKNSLFFKIGRHIEHWLYKTADLIIPVTKCSESIIKKRSNGTPTQVIPNGVDLENFSRVSDPIKEVDEEYDPNKFRVGYVGSLGVIHDLHTFVEAAKICEDDPQIEFIIVGDGGSRSKLEKAIELFDPQNLTWVGLKEHSKVPAYISSFDIAINPVYDAEIFESIVTVKFFEYMACGVPVITLGRGLLKEEGDRSGAAITLEPENAQILAQAIKDLKADPEKRQKMAQNARAFIQQNYSRKEAAETLSKSLKKLIDKT